MVRRSPLLILTIAVALAAILRLTSHRGSADAGTTPAKAVNTSTCIGPRNTDANLAAIVEEVFVAKPKELLNEKIIAQDFFDDIRVAQFEICDDRVLDVVTYPRSPPLVVFDSFFMTLLGIESESLVIGQYLANEHPRIGTLDLHTALMRNVLAQNLNKSAPSIKFPELVNQMMGSPTDIDKYLSNPKVKGEIDNFILTSYYFVIFHEFCHVHSRDPQKRQQIAKMPMGAAREAMLVQLEKDADSCAMDIMNRDEAQYKFSPISFFSAFMVASTQVVLERVLPTRDGMATHPSSQDRLDSAYRKSLTYIQGSPDASRYKAALDSVYQHFTSVVTH